MTAAEVAATLAAQDKVDPLVVELARALSLATRIETELVRLMRIELFPQSDVGLEANLWFSPLVDQRDALGLSLVSECREELRRQLTLPIHRSTLQRAWEVIASCHRPGDDAGIAPVLKVQEAVTYHALASASPADWSAHREAMQLEFGTLYNALDDDTSGALAQWIASALPALPEAARQSPGAIALAEKLRASDSTLFLETIVRAAVSASTQGLQWPASEMAIGLRRRTDGIEFRVPSPEGSEWLSMQLPDTSPLALQLMTPLRDGWSTETFTFEGPSLFVAVPMPASRCRITTVSGQRIAIQPTFAGKPTLAVLGLRGPEDPRREDIAAVTADLGWQLRIEGKRPTESMPAADAVLALGGASDADPYAQNMGPSEALGSMGVLLVMTPTGVEPVGSSEPGLALKHGEGVFSAEFSADGSRIATAGSGAVQIWDAAAGLLLATLPLREHVSRAATFSPDGRRVAIGSNDGLVRLLDVDTGALLQEVEGHDDWVMSAEFSRTGRRLVTASQDHTVALWSVGGELRKTRTVIGHSAAVYHASFSPDESRIATASADRTVAIVDVQNGERLATLPHEDEILSAVWSGDGRVLLTADFAGRAWLWNVVTQQRVPLPFVHEAAIHFATFSPDSRRVACATADGRAWVWHVPSRALMAAPFRHTRPTPGREIAGSGAFRARDASGVYSVAFSPDGTHLLTGGADGRALVWDLADPSRAQGPLDIDPGRDDVVGSQRLTKAQVYSLRAQLLALDESRLIAWSARSTVSPDVDAAPRSAPPAPAGRAIAEHGRNALIAIIGGGVDFLHETFLDEKGQSRIVGIWDQQDMTGPAPAGFNRGTYHSAANIGAYVEAATLPSRLVKDAMGLAHGTHAASIAAGRRVASFAGGMAPDARILVVLPDGDQPTGYSEAHVEALTFIDQQAQSLGLPVVVNVTQGMNAGAHDGTSLLEVSFDAFSKEGRAPGRVIVKSAGNDADKRTHAELSLGPGLAMDLSWTCNSDPWLRHRMELWWDAGNKCRFRLASPDGEETDWVDRGTREVEGKLGRVRYALRFVEHHVDNGDSQLTLELGRGISSLPRGPWSLRVQGVEIVTPGSIHAWIERDIVTAEFLNYVSERMTLTVPGTAKSVILVGAVTADELVVAAPFSSLGPTRDGRQKPDVAAPGIKVSGARAGTRVESVEMDGTAMAAAHVAGVIALMLSQAAGSGRVWPTAAQISTVLRQTTRNYSGVWNDRIGYGVVDAAAALAAFAESPR